MSAFEIIRLHIFAGALIEATCIDLLAPSSFLPAADQLPKGSIAGFTTLYTASRERFRQ